MSYNTVDQAEAWAKAHPTKDVGEGGPSWASWCAALMFWAGGFERSVDTATIGSHASSIVSASVTAAPRGAFHWWRMGSEGHVALDLDGGGTRLLMASSAVSNFGSAIGTTSHSAYGGRSYAGWSSDFVGQRLSDVGAVSGGSTGDDSLAQGVVLQRLAQGGGYSGPVDGAPGPNTWKGVQTLLRSYGYAGPIDGTSGPNTWKALQRLAVEGGYGGPIDGVPGPLTWAALIRVAT